MKYYFLFLFFTINLNAQLVEDFIISENALTPDIALDNDGFIHIIFDKTDYNSSWPLSVVSLIKLDEFGSVINPVVSISDSIFLNTPTIEARNNFLATAWRNDSPTTWNSFIDGKILSIPNNINIGLRYNSEYYDSERFNPNIAWLSDSTFIIVWQGDAPPLYKGIYGRMTNSDGSFIRFDILLTDHVENVTRHFSPKVVSPKGSDEFFVFWSDDFNGKINIWGRCFAETGEPKESSFCISEDTFSNQSWIGEVAINSDNEIVVIWNSELDSVWEVKMRWYDLQGNPISSIEKIDDCYSYSNNDIDLSFDKDNKFVVFYKKVKDHIYGQRYNSDKIKYGKPFKLTPHDVSQFVPRVELLNDKIFTTWNESFKYKFSVWANIIDFYDPLLDFREVVDVTFIDRPYAFPGKDSIFISTKVNETEGYILFAEFENEDGLSIDSVYLNNGGTVIDSIFTNYWVPPRLLEQNYSINLHTALNKTDTVSYKREDVANFTTKGSVVINEVKITSTDIIPNPGDIINFKISLLNEGLLEKVDNIKAIISTEDSCIFSIYKSLVVYGNILPGQTILPENEFVIKVDPKCSGDNIIKFNISLLSNEVEYWSDNFTIYVDTLTSINDENNLPIEYKLYQNYPNPFNPKTTINYQLPKREFVKLEVFNILGERELELVNSFKDAGRYNITFDASSFSSGIYLYKIKIGAFSDVKKMLLIK